MYNWEDPIKEALEKPDVVVEKPPVIEKSVVNNTD